MSTMHAVITAVGIAGTTLGCAPREARREDAPPVEAPPPPPPTAIPPEKLDEVQSTCRRKTTVVQSCYTDEMERGGNRRVEGAVTVAFTLSTAGKPVEARILTTTLKSAPIEECIVGLLRSWEFVELPVQAEVNCTFSFKPAY